MYPLPVRRARDENAVFGNGFRYLPAAFFSKASAFN